MTVAADSRFATRTPPPVDEWLVPVLPSVLTGEQLAAVLAGRPARLWDAILATGRVSEERLLHMASVRLRVPLADLDRATAASLALVPEKWVRRFGVLPIGERGGAIEVAAPNPFDLDCERTLAFATGRSIRLLLAPPKPLATRLQALLDEAHRSAAGARSLPPPTSVTARPSSRGGQESEATRTVDALVEEAVLLGASDIHIEPTEQGVDVRHRIDGLLRGVRMLPPAIAAPLVSRVKIVSGLDIADRLRPQDGRARVTVRGAPVDLRVSTLPAAHGEKVVIRILDTRAAARTLEGMGFDDGSRERLERLLAVREGLILVTGPTGSGKTTTLYAALRQIKERGVNVVTVEDPIEYRIPGVVQVQVHERAGLTFAAALRSIMRQDPDVLLIGEIRDRETAEIAIQASLTGHLVLSTMHTNDAPSAVARLVDIGVDPYKIATALKGVVAQRLVRRLCSACRGPVPESDAQAPERALPRGCPRCAGSGYRGRLAIAEVLVTSPEFERAVAHNEPVEQLAHVARDAGMGSLWTSGLRHVANGETTTEELRRVTEGPRPDARAPELPPVVRERPAGVGVRGAHATIEPMRVALALREETEREALRALLAAEGFEAEVAPDAEALANLALRGIIDAIVADFAYPRLDVAARERYVHARPTLSSILTVVLIDGGDARRVLAAYAAGADVCLARPAPPRCVVGALLALRRRVREATAHAAGVLPAPGDAGL